MQKTREKGNIAGERVYLSAITFTVKVTMSSSKNASNDAGLGALLELG